jgi:hypothetical protein
MDEDNNKPKSNKELSPDEETILRNILIKEMKSRVSSKLDSNDSSVLKSFKKLLDGGSDAKE